jgi:hypothetical protein
VSPNKELFTAILSNYEYVRIWGIMEIRQSSELTPAICANAVYLGVVAAAAVEMPAKPIVSRENVFIVESREL